MWILIQVYPQLHYTLIWKPGPVLLNRYDWARYDLDVNMPKQNDFLQRMTQMDFENYLPEDILVKGR